MTADRDAGRRVIGIELLDVRERLGGDPPRDVTIEWLTDDDDA